jgi:hypothetical protein
MATHLEDPKTFQRALSARVADSSSLAAPGLASCPNRNPPSSGVVEGLNNKAKVTLRKSYGLRTYRVLELSLYHSLGKLPEPECTHDFF